MNALTTEKKLVFLDTLLLCLMIFQGVKTDAEIYRVFAFNGNARKGVFIAPVSLIDIHTI